MKKYSIALFVVALVSLPGMASAQSACVMDAQSGNPTVLAVNGGRQLTQMQADCSLELIDFMAAAVRGVDLIQVDEPMRQIWRRYLADRYPLLPQADRAFLANSPMMFYNVTTRWPRLTPASQNVYRRSWGSALPPVLQFIQPVVNAARQQQAWQVANGARSGSGTPATDPVAEANRQAQISNSLAVHNYKMNIYTTDLMNSMNHMSGH